MNMWTTDEEAERLAARFAGKNRAKFARDFGVPGGQVMIYQHITGRRPIGLDAAEAYAKGFGCPLEEISPRLAQEAKKAFAMLGTDVVSEVAAERDLALSDDEIDLVSMYRGLSAETKRFVLVQLKTFADQILENVNHVSASIGGNMERGATGELHPTQTHTARGIGVSGDSGKQLSIDGAIGRAKRIIGVRSASPSTEKKERKSGQSR
jgi:hypothetical protein